MTTRNTKPIGIGSAIDKLVALNATRARREAEALQQIREVMDDIAGRILYRVPADLRPRVITMLMVSEDEADRAFAERLRARLAASLAHQISLEADPEDDLPPELPRVDPDDEPDMVAIPKALQEEYRPSERLTGKARSGGR